MEYSREESEVREIKTWQKPLRFILLKIKFEKNG
jgi:hypothetical protein